MHPVRTIRRPRLARLSFKLAFLCAAAAVTPMAHADEAQLRAEIAELRAQIAEMKAQMKTIVEQGKAAPGTPAAATTAAPTGLAARLEKLEETVAKETVRGSDTTLTSYGEIAYSRPRNDVNQTTEDLVRAVIGFGHRFDDKTRVYGEFEWEHAVTSADDKGEAAVEQLYVERQLTDRFGARAGLMLIPLGFLNE